MKKKFLKQNYRIRALQLLFAVVTAWGFMRAPMIWILVGLAAYAVLETLAGNIALHRYFGHRSFETNRFWHRALSVIAHYIGVGSVISWVGQHRYHHLHSDTVRDVHCPRNTGIWRIVFGIWKVRIERSMIRDVLRDPLLIALHRNYWTLHLFLISTFLIVDHFGGTWTLFALYAMPNLMCLLSGYMLAILPHLHGYQTYATNDESRNCWITNIYTLGEGWHNNHHAYPTRLRQGERAWEWDFPAFVIETFLAARVKS